MISLKIKINHIAYSFGDLESFNEKALNIAKKRFQFIYTGMRGDNAQNLNPFAIRRDAIRAIDSKNIIGSYLLGAADFMYNKKFAFFESWGN